MTVEGREYGNDLILFPDRVSPGWWRREGHSLAPEDLEEVIRYGAVTLVLGTGDSGMMEVPASTRKFLEEKGVELLARPTAEAVAEYNRLREEGREGLVGAFHLTC
jgi:hypothetical protein